MVATGAERAATWTEANQRYLVAELARIRGILEGQQARAAEVDRDLHAAASNDGPTPGPLSQREKGKTTDLPRQQ